MWVCLKTKGTPVPNLQKNEALNKIIERHLSGL